MAEIHPTALVHPQAELDSTVSVGAYTLIGPHVKIGARTSIGPHCVLEGHTTLGEDNRISPFVSLGLPSQDKKYAGEPCQLVIGDRNTIREYSTYHIGTAQGGGLTRLGSDNWMMAYTHLAHDCVVGNHTVFANNAQLGGHVEVGDWAILGGYTVVHQFVRIGAHVMTAMSSLLFGDVPPYVMVQGQPARARAINLKGLSRRGFTAERIAAVKAMYRALYRDNLTLEQAQSRIAELAERFPQAAADVALMSGFLQRMSTARGIVR